MHEKSTPASLISSMLREHFGVELLKTSTYDEEHTENKAIQLVNEFYSQNGLEEDDILPLVIDAAQIYEFQTISEGHYQPPADSMFWTQVFNESPFLENESAFKEKTILPVQITEKYYLITDKQGRSYFFIDHSDCISPLPQMYSKVAEIEDPNIQKLLLEDILSKSYAGGDQKYIEEHILAIQEAGLDYDFVEGYKKIQERGRSPMHCYIAGIDLTTENGQKIAKAALSQLHHNDRFECNNADLLAAYKDDPSPLAILSVLPNGVSSIKRELILLALTQKITSGELSRKDIHNLVVLMTDLGRSYSEYSHVAEILVNQSKLRIRHLGKALLQLDTSNRELIMPKLREYGYTNVELELLLYYSELKENLVFLIEKAKKQAGRLRNPPNQLSTFLDEQALLDRLQVFTTEGYHYSYTPYDNQNPRFMEPVEQEEQRQINMLRDLEAPPPYIIRCEEGGAIITDHAPFWVTLLNPEHTHNIPYWIAKGENIGTKAAEYLEKLPYVALLWGPILEKLATFFRRIEETTNKYKSYMPVTKDNERAVAKKLEELFQSSPIPTFLRKAVYPTAAIGCAFKLFITEVKEYIADTHFTLPRTTDDKVIRIEQVKPLHILVDQAARVRTIKQDVEAGIRDSHKVLSANTPSTIGKRFKTILKDKNNGWSVRDYERKLPNYRRITEKWGSPSDTFGTIWYTKATDESTIRIVTQWHEECGINITDDENFARSLVNHLSQGTEEAWNLYWEANVEDRDEELLQQAYEFSNALYEVLNLEGMYLPNNNLHHVEELPFAIRDLIQLVHEKPVIPSDIPNLKPGTMLTLTGNNGSGKSTIMRSIAYAVKLITHKLPIPASTFSIRFNTFTSDAIPPAQRQNNGSSLFTRMIPELNRAVEPKSEKIPIWFIDEMGIRTSKIYALAIAFTTEIFIAAQGGIPIQATHLSELTKYCTFFDELKSLGINRMHRVIDNFKLREPEEGEQPESWAISAIAQVIPDAETHLQSWPDQSETNRVRGLHSLDTEKNDWNIESVWRDSIEDALGDYPSRIIEEAFGVSEALVPTFIKNFLTHRKGEKRAGLLKHALEIPDKYWNKFSSISEQYRTVNSLLSNDKMCYEEKIHNIREVIVGDLTIHNVALFLAALPEMEREKATEEVTRYLTEIFGKFRNPILLNQDLRRIISSHIYFPSIDNLLATKIQYVSNLLTNNGENNEILETFNINSSDLEDIRVPDIPLSYLRTVQEIALGRFLTLIELLSHFRQSPFGDVSFTDKAIYKAKRVYRPGIQDPVRNNTFYNLQADKGHMITGENHSGKTTKIWSDVLNMITSLSLGLTPFADHVTIGRKVVPVSLIQPVTDNFSLSGMQREAKERIRKALTPLYNDKFHFIIFYDEPAAPTSPEDARKTILWLRKVLKRTRSCFVHTTHCVDIPSDENIKETCFTILEDEFKEKAGRADSNALKVAYQKFGLDPNFFMIAQEIEAMIRGCRDNPSRAEEIQMETGKKVVKYMKVFLEA